MLDIRKATIADAELLSRIGSEMFYETFAGDNTEEDMRDYLNGNFTVEAVEEKMKDPARVYYIAETDAEPVGYLQLLPQTGHAQLEGEGFCIERIYVYKKFQGIRAGAALMAHCITLAEENLSAYIWLGVWEHNTRAIAFYERWGFTAFGNVSFVLGQDRQTDILMYKPVSAVK